MYRARLASRFPPRLRRCRTTLPEEASMGDTPQRLAKEASLLNLWGLSPATVSSVAAWSVPMPAKETSSGATCLTSRSSCASSSAISAESLVTASRRTESEFGCRQYVTRIISEAEACGHGDELLSREPAQTVAQFLRCRHPQALELVSGLRSGLHSGAASGP